MKHGTGLRRGARLAAVAVALVATATAAPEAGAAVTTPRALHPLPGEWWFPAWEIQSRVWPLTRGKGVTVAVLGPGVQANVSDLRGAVIPGGDTTGAGTNGMTDHSTYGHGTIVASLIAGQGRGDGMVGIAPGARILPVRVGGGTALLGGGTPATEAAGIRFAVNHGAEVINLSFGGAAVTASSCNPGLQQAIAYALRRNVVLVAAAGNDGASGNPPEQPASCAGVLAVGGVNPNLTLWRQSERQPYVAVAAPGNKIVGTGLGDHLGEGNGTSFACALVSGEVALVRARYPGKPWQWVVRRIIGTSLRRGHPVPNSRFGYGIVRVAGAVDAARYPVPASAPDPVAAAFERWLRSRGRTATPQRASSPAAAPAPPAGNTALPVLLGIAVVVALAGVSIPVVVRRRRRPAGGPGPQGQEGGDRGVPRSPSR